MVRGEAIFSVGVLEALQQRTDASIAAILSAEHDLRSAQAQLQGAEQEVIAAHVQRDEIDSAVEQQLALLKSSLDEHRRILPAPDPSSKAWGLEDLRDAVHGAQVAIGEIERAWFAGNRWQKVEGDLQMAVNVASVLRSRHADRLKESQERAQRLRDTLAQRRRRVQDELGVQAERNDELWDSLPAVIAPWDASAWDLWTPADVLPHVLRVGQHVWESPLAWIDRVMRSVPSETEA